MVYMIINLSICYIHYIKMQLNDVIKSFSWYRAFVDLLMQFNSDKNSIDIDTGIGIGASLMLLIPWKHYVLIQNLLCPKVMMEYLL